MYKIIVFLLLFLFTPLSGVVVYGADSQSTITEPIFSIEVNNKPFIEVADEIFKQTGYRVIFDEKWNSLLVTGKYSNVTIEEFSRRVFRSLNTSLLVNDENKIYVIRFFGDKSFAALLADAPVQTEVDGVEIPKENQEKFEAAKAEMERILNDPTSIDPVSGLSLGEIREIHIRAQEEKDLSFSDPDAIDPTTGLTRAEIEEKHKAAKAEMEKILSNPESVDPVSGLSIREIEQRNRNAQAEKQSLLNNPGTVDPITGFTLGEIRAKSAKGND